MIADYSHFALWLAGLATLTQAYTTPVGETPSGNSIAKPGLNEAVPAGKPYTITWTPTTTDCSTVDLVLLRGPSTNIKPLYAIAENVANSGSYAWTPSSSLEPDTTHYGIQLICDQSGAYQYTTQFGISNPSWSSSSSSEGVTSTRSVHLASSSISSSSFSSSSISSAHSYISSGFPVPGNSTVHHATGTVSHKLSSAKPTKTTIVTATNTPTDVSTPTTPSTGPATATTTNGASAARAAVGLMGLAAAAVFAL